MAVSTTALPQMPHVEFDAGLISRLVDLMNHIHRWFQLTDDDKGEYSIEVDPRSVSAECIHRLRKQGFNRISLGVQDTRPVGACRTRPVPWGGRADACCKRSNLP